MEVAVCDVGPRDGLQNDKETLAPQVRAELCDRLAAAGLRRIESASFVNPKRVPQMGGAAEVMAAITPRDDVVFSALALNVRGLDDALAAGVREIHCAYAISDTFGERNQGMTRVQGREATEAMVTAARAAGVRVTVAFITAFGCPFEGPVDPGVVVDEVGRMAAAGADELMLADTIGVAVPGQVRRLMRDALAVAGGTPVGLHLHNTRNTGYANASVGLEEGASVLDSSIGGLGGCPFAPRATGNIATEDLAYLLDGEGVDTGLDLEALIEVSHWLAGVLGRELPSLVSRAGPFVPVEA